MTKKRQNFISLYPLFPNEALRAVLQTPPEKKRIARAAMQTTKDKPEVFKEKAAGGAKFKSKGGSGKRSEGCGS
jgi:hypothetical protein